MPRAITPVCVSCVARSRTRGTLSRRAGEPGRAERDREHGDEGGEAEGGVGRGRDDHAGDGSSPGRGEACQAVGGHALADHAQQRLGVRFGETTADGSTTLDQVFCLGLCALSPAVTVDGRARGRVDAAAFDALVAAAPVAPSAATADRGVGA